MRVACPWLAMAVISAFGLPLSGCEKPVPPDPHFQLGAPYQAGGVWYYPRESYNAVRTGLAAVAPPRHAPLTANGEAYDPSAMAAGQRTLQLPAIARVTNLENGMQVLVRINDRGPTRPGRLLELTPRAADLLGVPAGGGTQIRLEVLEPESRAAVEGLRGAPRLAIATAPRGVVRAEALGAPGTDAAMPVAEAAAPEPARAAPPHLPEQRTRTAPSPGRLYIRLGSFSRAEFAQRQRARVAQFSPALETEREGRQTVYKLRIGPLPGVAAADATLERVIRAGITDARIVVGTDAGTGWE